MTCYGVVCVEPPAAALVVALGPWVALVAYLWWLKNRDDDQEASDAEVRRAVERVEERGQE